MKNKVNTNYLVYQFVVFTVIIQLTIAFNMSKNLKSLGSYLCVAHGYTNFLHNATIENEAVEGCFC